MTLLYPLGTALLMLGLALLIGGMLALGAFTAPVLFKMFPREAAGEAMTLIFRRYDQVILGGTLLILVGEALRVWTTGGIQWTMLPIVRSGALLLLIGMAAFSLAQVNPKMEAMQQAGKLHQSAEQAVAFRNAHELSEKLYKMELMLALLVLILTPFSQRIP